MATTGNLWNLDEVLTELEQLEQPSDELIEAFRISFLEVVMDQERFASTLKSLGAGWVYDRKTYFSSDSIEAKPNRSSELTLQLTFAANEDSPSSIELIRAAKQSAEAREKRAREAALAAKLAKIEALEAEAEELRKSL